ncbi:hypothetical protein ABVT39_023107 [Epinephelus coioides]
MNNCIQNYARGKIGPDILEQNDTDLFEGPVVSLLFQQILVIGIQPHMTYLSGTVCNCDKRPSGYLMDGKWFWMSDDSVNYAYWETQSIWQLTSPCGGIDTSGHFRWRDLPCGDPLYFICLAVMALPWLHRYLMDGKWFWMCDDSVNYAYWETQSIWQLTSPCGGIDTSGHFRWRDLPCGDPLYFICLAGPCSTC